MAAADVPPEDEVERLRAAFLPPPPAGRDGAGDASSTAFVLDLGLFGQPGGSLKAFEDAMVPARDLDALMAALQHPAAEALVSALGHFWHQAATLKTWARAAASTAAGARGMSCVLLRGCAVVFSQVLGPASCSVVGVG